ncbi:TetR/AcrR family transcriptional regulator [Streptomyces sp. MT29]|nr:TetR/AcrR family transcriptional regulator [Streptomyces sp. MT29]
MKQARSARTRQALIEAAAGEFDRHGYAGCSLAQISKAAGISMGALTFHFSSKEELAATVRSRGHYATTAVVHEVSATEAAPAQAVVQLTLALARLLQDEAVVRAAARLTQERPGAAADWDSAWAADDQRLACTRRARRAPIPRRSRPSPPCWCWARRRTCGGTRPLPRPGTARSDSSPGYGSCPCPARPRRTARGAGDGVPCRSARGHG